MAIERTEAEMVTMAPIVVQFGTKSYEVKPLAMGPSEKWKKKVLEETKAALEPMTAQVESFDQLFDSLSTALFALPRKIAELVFAYAPDLPRDEILDAATEEQYAIAFEQIKAVANPLKPTMTGIGAAGRASSASPKFLN